MVDTSKNKKKNKKTKKKKQKTRKETNEFVRRDGVVEANVSEQQEMTLEDQVEMVLVGEEPAQQLPAWLEGLLQLPEVEIFLV